ncbi:hypothetical protein [Petroclostridium sp. X23]|nr:hypothetical protein [Petroclostridium sp. X23]WHH60759.1 hypothetical protein QKW49_08695 [Petroclostridium sp. X23]
MLVRKNVDLMPELANIVGKNIGKSEYQQAAAKRAEPCTPHDI